MEIKNECIITEDLFIEAYRFVVRKTRFIVLTIALAIMALGLYFLFITQLAGMIICVVIAILVAVFALLYHKFKGRSEFKGLCNKYKVKEFKRTTTITSNRIDMFTKNFPREQIRIGSITKTFETKNLYVFMSGKDLKGYICKDEACFTEGSFAQLKAYMDKMVYIRGRDE